MGCTFHSHRGLLRERNEDFHGRTTTEEGALLVVVADGMGGHAAGDVASRMAVETVLEVAAFSTAAPEALLRKAIGEANRRVFERSCREPEMAGMGTTVVALLLCPEGNAWTAHVGDSRAYLQRSGRLEALTADHSVVAELQRRGLLSEEEAARDPRRSQLTRCVGLGSEVEVDVARLDARVGDRFLLCSDGLSGVVEAPRIAELLAETEVERAAQALVEAANERGGPDNVTVSLAWLG